jgi:arylsulfatase A-like enzyme
MEYYMKSRNTIFTAVIAMIMLSSCIEEKKPNILFIMSDDHTSQAWGIYGGILKDYVQNKNISRLADEGAVLNNAFCTNSICTPSRATILSGQYSHKNGIYTLTEAYEPDSSNIAKVLKANGYQTAIIGKWHLKKEPTGFDHYMVLPGQGRYHNPILKTKENWKDHYEGGKEYKGFSSDLITDFTIDWLKGRDPEKPFMMMCHFKATHEPFDYPDRLASLYKDEEIPEPASLYDFNRENGRVFTGQSIDRLGQRYISASTGPWWTDYPDLPFDLDGLDSIQARKKTYQKFVKDFMRCGAAIDENIGRLLDYLEESGEAENTVVIYTADQGYFLGEHGFFDKRMIYEESLRMPFVIRYPKEIKGGSRIDDIILNIDFPTLMADYAGIEKPVGMQGRSFRELLKGNSVDDWRKSMYYRYWLHSQDRPGHFGIRNEQYKLAFFYGQSLGKLGTDSISATPSWEFYDLKTDPKEGRNSYADPKYADVIKDMKVELLKQKELVGDSDDPYPVMKEVMAAHWD